MDKKKIAIAVVCAAVVFVAAFAVPFAMEKIAGDLDSQGKESGVSDGSDEGSEGISGEGIIQSVLGNLADSDEDSNEDGNEAVSSEQNNSDGNSNVDSDNESGKQYSSSTDTNTFDQYNAEEQALIKFLSENEWLSISKNNSISFTADTLSLNGSSSDSYVLSYYKNVKGDVGKKGYCGKGIFKLGDMELEFEVGSYEQNLGTTASDQTYLNTDYYIYIETLNKAYYRVLNDVNDITIVSDDRLAEQLGDKAAAFDSQMKAYCKENHPGVAYFQIERTPILADVDPGNVIIFSCLGEGNTYIMAEWNDGAKKFEFTTFKPSYNVSL